LNVGGNSECGEEWSDLRYVSEVSLQVSQVVMRKKDKFKMPPWFST